MSTALLRKSRSGLAERNVMNELMSADPTKHLDGGHLVDSASFKTALRNVSGSVSIVTSGRARGSELVSRQCSDAPCSRAKMNATEAGRSE